MTNKQATKKVLKMKAETKVDDLANLLGMTKTTMYKRLTTGEWKKPERALIESL